MNQDCCDKDKLCDHHASPDTSDVNCEPYNQFLSFKLETYKQLYQDELQQRDILYSRMQWAVSIVVIILGAFIWTIRMYFQTLAELSCLKIVVGFLFIAVNIIASTLFIFLSIRCIKNYEMGILDPKKVNLFMNDNTKLIGHYSQDELLNHCYETFAQDYMTCIQIYHDSTETRIKYVNRMYSLLFLILLITFILFVLVI